jgi:transposase
MPKSYSGDLRARVIDAVEMGASRREAADRYDVSVSSAVKWLQRWRESGSAAPKLRGGSTSRLEAQAERILAVIAERPDLTLKETLVELLKRRIKTSRSALSRFFGRHNITVKKKPARSGATARPGRGDAGFESKACLIPLGWCLSTRLRSAPIWCVPEAVPRGATD